MNTLEQYISSIISPYDEGSVEDQTNKIRQGYFLYQQDFIVENIGKKENEHFIKLFLDDLLNILNKTKRQNFSYRILESLVEKYFLNVLDKYITLDQTLDDNKIIELLKYLELNEYIENFSDNLPTVDIQLQYRSEKIFQFVNDNYFIIKEGIDKNIQKFPKLLQEFFIYSSREDFIKFFDKIISKDVLSIIVLQNTLKKGD